MANPAEWRKNKECVGSHRSRARFALLFTVVDISLKTKGEAQAIIRRTIIGQFGL